ncbi:MAG: GNAT family N-acetyltransferase [Phycisphaeraceae bacterium]|nr:GNAT family N-acetyltransferase [Phycisphaeraceae bacterium]
MPRVLENLRELAVVEQRPEGRDAVCATEEQLWAMLAGPQRMAECVMIELVGAGSGANEGTAAASCGADERASIVGHAWLGFVGGTFGGKPWLYVEDLYLDAAHRGGGLGRRVMAMLARLAIDRGCAGLVWSVVTANAGAIRFYERLGAELTTDSVEYSLSGEALERLAERA